MTKKPDLIVWTRGCLWMCREDRKGSPILTFEGFADLLASHALSVKTSPTTRSWELLSL